MYGQSAPHAAADRPLYTGPMFHKSKLHPLILVGLAVFMAGCASPANPAAPTPFPTAAALGSTTSLGATTLTLTEVNSALGLHENQLITVSGKLQRQPVLVCDDESFLSPATWALTDNNMVLLASGFGDQVRLLLPENLTMTVEGNLRRWSGPVGCGKQAQSQEVWYLEASRILSPSPLTQATLTPEGVVDGGQGVVAVVPTPDVAATAATPLVAPTAEGALPTVTTEQLPPTPTIAAAGNTPEAAATAEPTLSGAAFTPTVPVSGTVPATGSVTPTPGPGTPTATSGDGNTPAPTIAVGNRQVVDKGDVFEFEEDFPAGELGSNQVHSWTLELFAGDTYDIKVIAPAPANLSLSLFHDGQAVIPRQNTAPAGAAEVMSIRGQPEGTYQILVDNDLGQVTDYIMVLSSPDDFVLELMGFLTSGAPRNNLTIPDFVSHYWSFTAEDGNDVTITVSPTGDNNPLIYLYGPNGVFITDMDDNEGGVAEVLTASLDEDGLYTIVVEDVEGNEMVYSITLDVQP